LRAANSTHVQSRWGIAKRSPLQLPWSCQGDRPKLERSPTQNLEEPRAAKVIKMKAGIRWNRWIVWFGAKDRY
jgi:hypothetical protein